MTTTLEETLISVWQQALAENARSVSLEDRSFPVRRTSRSRLREVDFEFEGHQLRGLEQRFIVGARQDQLNRNTKLHRACLQQMMKIFPSRTLSLLPKQLKKFHRSCTRNHTWITVFREKLDFLGEQRSRSLNGQCNAFDPPFLLHCSKESASVLDPWKIRSKTSLLMSQAEMPQRDSAA